MPVDAKNAVAFQIEAMPPLKDLELSWRDVACLGNKSFFTSWNWIGTWLQTLPVEVEPQLIRATRDGSTVALAIAVFKRARRHFIIDVRQLHFNSTGDPRYDGITIEHNDFCGEAGLMPAFVAWFRDGGCADELVIPGTDPANVPAAKGLLLSARKVAAFAQDRLDTVVQSGFGAVLSRNARQKINRNIRELSRFGALRLDEAVSLEDAYVYFDALKNLHTHSWGRRGKRNAFDCAYFEIFHRALISSGSTQLLRVAAGEHVIGYLYNFRQDGVVYAYQSGFADEDGKDRPGYVSHALAIEHCAGQAVVRYDFLAGDNRLKRTFGTAEYFLCWSTYSRPTMALRFEAGLRAVRDSTFRYFLKQK